MVASDDGDLQLELRGSVLLVVLDRPEARNALTRATRSRLVRLCQEIDGDDNIGAVVLTGTDPAFSSGVDLKEGLAGGGAPSRANPGQALRAMATPVVAAVNGACVSGALEVALSCSFIIASEKARFADTHARVGLIPGWGLSALLPQAVGVRRARQMTLTGEFVPASQALAWGLVNEVVPHARLLDRALEVAASVAGLEETIRRATLGLYDRGEGAQLATGLGFEAEARALWRVDGAATSARFEETVRRERRHAADPS